MLSHELADAPRRPLWKARDELFEAVVRGDAGAFRRLYDHYKRLVHGIALAHAPIGEVDDVVQDVFERAANKIHEIRNPRAFQRWLTQTTRNCCVDVRRKRGNKMTQTLPPDVGRDPPRVAEAIAILDAMGELSEKHREILILRFVEGYMGPEIAAQLGMTRGAVRVRLCRSMKKLRKLLDGGKHQ